MINHEVQYSLERFNHAAAICTSPSQDNRLLIAFYTGELECHSSQRVVIYRYDEGKIEGPIELEFYTGNPVLFKSQHFAYIIYTKFEKFPNNRAHWWQHCSIWQRKIDIDSLTLGEAKQIVFDEPLEIEDKSLGYVPRCNVIQDQNGNFLLPLYREHYPHFHGVILKSTHGTNWKYLGQIGADDKAQVIQPTLWLDGSKICSYSRNFKPRHKPYAYYAESLDMGKTWSPLVLDDRYLNCNNSILALSNGDPLVVWNNDSYGRRNPTLGYMGSPIIQLDSQGSYPAACWGNDNKLHICYTTKAHPYKHPDCRKIIKHKQFDAKAILQRKELLSPSAKII